MVVKMKKILLIVGILSLVACVIFLLFAALYMFGYRNVLDGSAELYKRLHYKMILFSVIGAVFALLGTACIILNFKLHP